MSPSVMLIASSVLQCTMGLAVCVLYYGVILEEAQELVALGQRPALAAGVALSVLLAAAFGCGRDLWSIRKFVKNIWTKVCRKYWSNSLIEVCTVFLHTGL